MQTKAWLSLGSNIDPEIHLSAAVDALREHFGELVISPVYESEALGFEGDRFLNLVVGISTDQPVDGVVAVLKAIEDRQGRKRGGERFASRTLDIDLLTYGDTVQGHGRQALPRDEITRYAFVLRPLADVAAEERHPVTSRTYRALWEAFEPGRQTLRLAAFQLR